MRALKTKLKILAYVQRARSLEDSQAGGKWPGGRCQGLPLSPGASSGRAFQCQLLLPAPQHLAPSTESVRPLVGTQRLFGGKGVEMRTPGEPSALATLEAWEVRKGRSWPSWGPLTARVGMGLGRRVWIAASVDRQASTQCRILFDSGIFPRRERGGGFTPFLHALEVHEKSHTPLVRNPTLYLPRLSRTCGWSAGCLSGRLPRAEVRIGFR